MPESTNGLIPFEHPVFGSIRIQDRNGKYWFIANDICKAIGLTNPRESLSKLSAGEKSTCVLPTAGGDQSFAIITLSAALKLIFRSRKPKAQELADWIADEVIPNIGKGHQATPNAIETYEAQIAQLTSDLEHTRLALAESQEKEYDPHKPYGIHKLIERTDGSEYVPKSTIAVMHLKDMNKIIRHVQYLTRMFEYPVCKCFHGVERSFSDAYHGHMVAMALMCLDLGIDPIRAFYPKRDKRYKGLDERFYKVYDWKWDMYAYDPRKVMIYALREVDGTKQLPDKSGMFYLDQLIDFHKYTLADPMTPLHEKPVCYPL